MRGFVLMLMLSVITNVMAGVYVHESDFKVPPEGDGIVIDESTIAYDYNFTGDSHWVVRGTLSFDIFLPETDDEITQLFYYRGRITEGSSFRLRTIFTLDDYTPKPGMNHIELSNIVDDSYILMKARCKSGGIITGKYICVYKYISQSDLDSIYRIKQVRYDYTRIDEQSVNYDYNLMREDTGVGCRGDFSFIASIPDKTVSAWVERSNPHKKNGKWPDGDWACMMYYDELELTPGADFVMVEEPDVEWGTFYRVKFLDEDGFKIYSQIINTSDYISEADMRKIQNNDVTSVETVADNDAAISVSGGVLTVCPETPATVRVYDLSGRCLLDCQVTEYTQIPLDTYARGPLIIQMHDGETSHTLKAFAR